MAAKFGKQLGISPQSPKSRGSFSATTIRKISLSLGVLFLMSSGSANAMYSSGKSDSYNQNPPIKLIAQTDSGTSEPPVVIVDTEPQDSDSTASTTNSDTRFTCQVFNGQYTVMYHPESQPDQSYPWAIPSKLGGGWTPELRCQEISRRLEFYRPDGLLELTTGRENNYNTLCVITERNSDCRIVLTVPPGQNPEITRDLVFENLTIADSGQQTQGVNTFAENHSDRGLVNQIDQILNLDLGSLGRSRSRRRSNVFSNGINLRPFLDPQDGGTGTRLDNGQSLPSSSRQLNPDRFR